MKIYYDKNSSDPTYYAQIGIRNGKKTTTRNVKNFGKHSELLKIADDPLAYVQKEIDKMNEEYRVGDSPFTLTINFNEKVSKSGDMASSPAWVNIGYFFIQSVMEKLDLKEFFRQKTEDRRLADDCFTVSRFLTYSRILNPSSELSAGDHPGFYYENPRFDQRQILRFTDLLEDNYTDYLTWLSTKSNNVVKPASSDFFYAEAANPCESPAYRQNPDRNRARFLISYTALLVQRLMEALLDKQGTNLTMDDLINTMKNMNVTNIHDVEYMALYNGSDALNALVELSGLNLDHLHYRPKDLNKMIKKISK